MLNKIKLYIISLMPLMALVVFSTFSVPIYFGSDWEFCEWPEICTLHNCVAVGALLMCAFGGVFLWQFNYYIKKNYDNLPTKIIEVKDLDKEYISFFFTLISCLVVDFNNWNGIVSFLFILIIFGVLFVKTDWFYANPSFACLGYHIYSVHTNAAVAVPDSTIVISKDKLKTGDSIHNISLSKNVLFTSKLKKK